ncbi:MAG TPA: phospholipase D-like domain-containing protein [Bdellovibrionales bacterium]|nr:phospholipase D-like domain-containing protein [Bdellovibrionales bacterium]
MFKRTYFLALIVSLLSSFAHAYETYFSPVDDLENIFVEKFKTAKKSIDLSIYTFSSTKVRDILLERMKEGVKVRLIINEGDDEAVRLFAKPLQEAGASARWVNETNHHKFAVIDSDRLVNSSGNLSGSAGSKKYDENLVFCDDCATLVDAFESEFEALNKVSNLIGEKNDVDGIEAGQDKKAVHKNFENALFTSSNFKPKFDAKRQRISFTNFESDDGTGKVDRVLIDAISQAKEEVLVATGHFRSKPLFDALKAAVARGVHVVVVSDGQEYVSKMGAKKQQEKLKECMKTHTEVECSESGLMFSRLLADAGIEMHLKYYSFVWNFVYAPQMHHKYMIVDRTTVYSGSYNWSYNAEYQSFENVAIYEGPEMKELIASYIQNFETILAYGGGSKDFEKTLSTLQDLKGEMPLHFSPITLTVSEVERYIAVAFKKCPKLFEIGRTEKTCKL